MSALYQRCKSVVESGINGNSTLLEVSDCQMVMDLHEMREAYDQEISLSNSILQRIVEESFINGSRSPISNDLLHEIQNLII